MTEQITTILTRNNVNVKKTLTNNVNDNVNKDEHTINCIAYKLEEKLNGGSEAWKFYCKVAWRLSEAEISRNLEQSLTGKSPQRYFSWLCKRSMSNAEHQTNTG